MNKKIKYNTKHMKKFLLIVVVLFLGNLLWAQEHQTFKGIEINGTTENFIRQMECKGFSIQRNKDGRTVLKGSFSGRPNCLLLINTLEKEDIVSSVQVLFERELTWTALANNYDTLKNMLTEKYGQPVEIKECFVNLYSDEDFLKITRLMSNDCQWRCTFETGVGQVMLYITYETEYGSHVVLEYRDRYNSMKQREAAMSDL